VHWHIETKVCPKIALLYRTDCDRDRLVAPYFNHRNKMINCLPVNLGGLVLSQALLFSALLLMAVTTSVAVATSYYLYRWRRLLTVHGKVVTVPEELIAHLAAFGKELRAIHSSILEANSDQTEQCEQFSRQINKSQDSISHLFETTVSLQGALDQRDAEIKRLKLGYDAELIRRFVARFIRVKNAVSDAESSAAINANTLQQISRLLNDALDECGVEEFRPKIGDDFRTAVGVADNPRLLDTQDEGQNFKIAEVLESGFRFRNREDDNVIVPARISIFLARTSGA
jgi:hypothetical protein